MIKAIAFDVGSTISKKIFWFNKDVLGLAIQLKKNYKVGIISNIVKFFSMLPVNQHIYSSFDKNLVILSFQVKINKPKREIYEIFIKRTGFAPNEYLFIDDRKKNVSAAEKIGMKGIVFKNFKQLIKEMAMLGIVLPSRLEAQN